MKLLLFGRVAIQENDLDRLAKGADLANLALSFGGLDGATDLGEEAALLFVDALFISQAAHEATASARDFLWVERETLVFGHTDGDGAKIAKEAATTKLLTARADATDEFCAIANADLAHLDAHPKVSCKIANDEAEIDAPFSGKVEDHLAAAVEVLCANEFHGKLMFFDALAAKTEGFFFAFGLFFFAADIFGRGAADRRKDAKARRWGLVRLADVFDIAECKTVFGLHDDPILGLDGKLMGREEKKLTRLAEGDFDKAVFEGWGAFWLLRRMEGQDIFHAYLFGWVAIVIQRGVSDSLVFLYPADQITPLAGMLRRFFARSGVSLQGWRGEG
jgi:hypothetical protein